MYNDKPASITTPAWIVEVNVTWARVRSLTAWLNTVKCLLVPPSGGVESVVVASTALSLLRTQLTMRGRGGCIGWRMHLLVIIPSSGRAVVVRRGAFCRHSRQTWMVSSEKRRHVFRYRRRCHVCLVITSGWGAAAGGTQEAVRVQTSRAHVAGLPIRACGWWWRLVVINSQTRWSFIPPVVVVMMTVLTGSHIHIFRSTKRPL